MCEALQQKADKSFTLTMGSLKELLFTGEKISMMLLNKKSNQWNIISLDDESVIMELDMEVTYCNYIIIVQDITLQTRLPPIGPFKWKIPSNICGDGKSHRVLFFTEVINCGYPCNNGECVPISQR